MCQVPGTLGFLFKPGSHNTALSSFLIATLGGGERHYFNVIFFISCYASGTENLHLGMRRGKKGFLLVACSERGLQMTRI